MIEIHCVSSGQHIDQNSEALRKRFVNHDGKKTLEVLRPEFVKGSKDNEWDGVIEEFVQQIDGNTVKDTVDLLDTAYSNTSAVEQIAGKVAIMDMMKHYFVYRMKGGCYVILSVSKCALMSKIRSDLLRI